MAFGGEDNYIDAASGAALAPTGACSTPGSAQGRARVSEASTGDCASNVREPCRLAGFRLQHCFRPICRLGDPGSSITRCYGTRFASGNRVSDRRDERVLAWKRSSPSSCSWPYWSSLASRSMPSAGSKRRHEPRTARYTCRLCLDLLHRQPGDLRGSTYGRVVRP